MTGKMTPDRWLEAYDITHSTGHGDCPGNYYGNEGQCVWYISDTPRCYCYGSCSELFAAMAYGIIKNLLIENTRLRKENKQLRKRVRR